MDLETPVDDTTTEPDDAAPAAPSPSTQAPPRRPIDYRRDGRKLMDRCKDDAANNAARLDRDRQDWLNLKFDRGGPDNQWVVWDQGTSRFVRRGTDPKQGGIPEGIPRVVSNTFANKINGIAALLDQSQPAQVWKPKTDDDADLATADVVEDALPVLFEEIDYVPGGLRTQIHKAIVLTDKVALCVYYDTDERHGVEAIPLLQCQDEQCGTEISPMEFEDAGEACPECGSTNVGDAIDPRGVPRNTYYPKGRMCARLFQSFEVSIPRSARSIDGKHVPWVLTHSRYTKQEAMANWKGASAAIDAGGASYSGASSLQRQYADAMRQLSSPRISSDTAMLGSREADGPVVFCLWHDPIDDGEVYLPRGFYGVDINGVLVECGPLPVEDDEGRAVKNILLRTFQQQPGSGFGKPPGDDLQPLQVSRNLTETLIQLILMHDAAPRTFVPLSVTLEDEITGLPSEVVRYRSHVPGERPTTDRGQNPPEGLYKYLEMIDRKFDELSGLNAVLQGARPQGQHVTAFEVQTLQERGMSAFRGPLDQLVRFEMDLARLVLWIAKRSMWSERFRQVRGENGNWEIRKFAASDLAGQVDCEVEPSSAWPKSQLMEMARLKDAFAMGLFVPPSQDPELASKLLVRMDLASLKPSMDVDRKQIARQLDRWKAASAPADITPPDPLWNLKMHLFLKSLFLKTEEAEQFAEQNPPVYQAMRAHVQQLQQMVDAAQAAQVAAQNPQPPAPPDTRTPVEQGDHSALHHAVDSGALVPAAAHRAAHAGVEDLLHAGVLHPAGGAAQHPTGAAVDALLHAGAITPAAHAQPGRPA